MPVGKNYIHRLQDENAEKQARIEVLERRLRGFLVHLQSPKFHGTDPGGDRRDWIATRDVNTRIGEILAT
jgi:hypothetical protein